MSAGQEQVEKVVLGIKEAAAVTPFSESTLYKAAKRGEAPFSKVQGRWVTTPDALREWATTGRPEPKKDFLAEVLQLRKESA